MASYNPVGSLKNADQPINVTLIDYLDQNPIAIAEGASGAPKIQNAAFDNNTINAGKLSDATVTQTQLSQKYYAGSWNSNATTVSLPSGWSVTNPTTGSYTLTHNLGTTNYSIVALPEDTLATLTPTMCFYRSKSTNSISIRVGTYQGSIVSRACQFVLIMH
jgi:hypothetical protein